MNEKRDSCISILKDEKSLQEERIQALFRLMNIADESSLNAIFNCLKTDSCEIVRHEAAFVLGECAAKESVNELKECITNDSSLIVRHEALLALGTLDDKSVIEFLREIEKSPEKLISESAKIALQRIELNIDPYRGPKEFEHLK